jgi:acylphosphatase
MSSQQNTRLAGTVTGLVQGVSFRWFVQRRAADLGLTGYVRNNSDGSVSFVAEGPRRDLDQLLDAVRTGPAEATVENVDSQWDLPTGEFHRFEIRF